MDVIAELRKRAGNYRLAAERLQVNAHANVGAAQALEQLAADMQQAKHEQEEGTRGQPRVATAGEAPER